MLKSLQVGRGIAALAVLAFHLSAAMGDPRYGGRDVFSAYTHRGNLGVDFFFVLSGFIILHAHQRDLGQPAAWPRYAYRRFVRLFPIYWIYAFGMSALVLLGFGTVAHVPQTRLGWLSSFTLIRFSSEMPPLGVAWTLFHELAFYTLFSVAILNKQLGLLVLGGWGLICVFSYQYPETLHPTAAAVYSGAYNLNFFFGMAAHELYRRGKGQWPLLISGAGIFIATITFEHTGYAVTPLLYAASFGMVIAGGAILERHGRLSAPAPLRLLGDASYTVYLIHVPVVGLLLKIMLAVRLDGLMSREVLYFVVFGLTAAIGALSYLLLEHPLLKALRGGLFKRSPPTRD